MKDINIKNKRKSGIIVSVVLIILGSLITETNENVGSLLILLGFLLLIISLTLKKEKSHKNEIKSFKIKSGNINQLVEYKKNLINSIKELSEEKNTYEKEISDIVKLKDSKEEIEKEINERTNNLEKLKKDENDIKQEISKALKFKKDVLILDELKKELRDLTKKKEQLEDDVDYLLEEKAILKDEIEKLETKQYSLNTKVDNSMYSIEYVDILKDGLEFERYWAMILGDLGFEDVDITSSSGDYGIDVLGTKDDIKYGFQCKLYSENVGNFAVQQAFSGKEHYKCNVAVVVTNKYFTQPAQDQATDTKVLLWDRDVLIEKINQARINKS